MNWCILHFRPLTTCLALLFDIIGACFVSWEVVNQYKGKRFKDVNVGELDIDSTSEDIVKEHPDYKFYETTKYYKMKWGLYFLTIGFVLQIVPNVLQCLDP